MKVRGGEAHIEILNLRNVKNFNAQCEAVKEEVQPLLNAVPLNMLKLFPSEAGDQHLPFNMDLSQMVSQTLGTYDCPLFVDYDLPETPAQATHPFSTLTISFKY